MRAFIFQTSENFPNSGTLIIEYNVAESAAANGIVTIQESAMLPINFMSTVFKPPLMDPVSTIPFAIPAPTIPITWQWVVDAGRPKQEHPMITIDALRTTANPYDGVNRLILDPIVMITRDPKISRPIEIPNPPHSLIPYTDELSVS